MTGFNNSPINSTNPYSINNSDIIKKGKREGKILFFQTEIEKLTEFNISFEVVKISKQRIKRIDRIKTLTIFFRIKNHLYDKMK